MFEGEDATVVAAMVQAMAKSMAVNSRATAVGVRPRVVAVVAMAAPME